jgi:hypothetical protein
MKDEEFERHDPARGTHQPARRTLTHRRPATLPLHLPSRAAPGSPRPRTQSVAAGSGF